MGSSRSRWFAAAATVALAAYLGLALVPGLSVGPWRLGTRHALVLLLLLSVLIVWSSGRLGRREGGRLRLLNLGVASLSILLSLLAADFLYSMLRSRKVHDVAVADVSYERASDPVIWHGELYPRVFHPTNQGFVLYKPDVSLRGHTYGEYYEHRLLASPLLRDSVLEYREVGYTINRHGLREDAALADARIFALGDSYVFGYATDEGAIWTDVLEQRIGEKVYNLGVSATGPRQQVQLLAYMLAAHADSMRPAHLLWMIYEGNDLENSYAARRAPPETTEASAHNVLRALAEVPRALRAGSVLHLLASGSLRLRARGPQDGTTEVDGVPLRNPLYHSRRWGYRLFNPFDIRAATRGPAYVRSHPNTAALATTFQALQRLSQQHGFRVTVILAPSDVRLYGAAFEGMPHLSAEPSFLQHVAGLAAAHGFAVVDLADLMKPYAQRELLYYRDDHHWNVRGNAVAALLLAQTVEFGNRATNRSLTALKSAEPGPAAANRQR